MGEERLEILKMVADKKITVEEAERLLRAVDEGQQRREREGGGRGGRGGFNLTEFFENVGSMVHGVVEEAVSGIGGEEREGLEEVPFDASGVALPAGTRLVVKNRGGDLDLVGVDGDRCGVIGVPSGNIRMLRGDDRVVLVFSGPAKLGVPGTVSSLKAALRGGAIRATSIACPLEAKTMGGEVALVDMKAPFDARTMGGEVLVVLAPELTGESKAETMGGDITVEIPGNLHARIEAKTMAGEVKVDPALGEARHTGRHAREKVELEIGENAGGEPAALRLKNMGGSIKLRRKA